MFDPRQIFAELQKQAGHAAKEFNADGAATKAKEVAGDIRKRLETDPMARNAAIGGAGLLLLGLIGSKGGRRFVGDVAQTGAVAALGALAYKAWADRKGGGDAARADVKTIEGAGFPIDPAADPEFSTAIIRTMLAAAYADGVLEADEKRIIDAALEKADLSPDERRMLTNAASEDETFSAIARAARSPNHAAELYAAAAVIAGSANERETAFLAKLADRLGIAPAHASAILAEAAA